MPNSTTPGGMLKISNAMREQAIPTRLNRALIAATKTSACLVVALTVRASFCPRALSYEGKGSGRDGDHYDANDHGEDLRDAYGCNGIRS